MSSRTRETRVVAAVPCHECGAAVGEECTFTPTERRKLERHVNGRLSDRASHYWPGALVIKEVEGSEVQWWLERVQPGLLPRVAIGPNHAEATRALGAIIRAHQAREAG